MKIYFDGSCGPTNPGGRACYGFAILDSEDKEVYTENGLVCEGEGATNNVAEYAALRNALLYARKSEYQVLEIFGDSALVVNQVNGNWKCKAQHLQPYMEECRQLLRGLNWRLTWVNREKNERADDLSKEKWVV